MPSYKEHLEIIEKIESFVSEYNIKNPGTLIFYNIDWLKKEATMFYRACCGGEIENKHYKTVGKALQKIYPFKNVNWKNRR